MLTKFRCKISKIGEQTYLDELTFYSSDTHILRTITKITKPVLVNQMGLLLVFSGATLTENMSDASIEPK